MSDRRRMTEAEFLAAQAAESRRAMREALADLKASAIDAADIRLWTRQYPWILTGTAAAAGFIAGTRTAPTKTNRRRRARAAARRRRKQKSKISRSVTAAADRKQDWRSEWKGEIGSALRRAITSLVVAAVASRTGIPGSGAPHQTDSPVHQTA